MATSDNPQPIKRTVTPPPGPPDWQDDGPQVSPETLQWLRQLEKEGKLPPVGPATSPDESATRPPRSGGKNA
jgi:hypothetical protein